MWTRVKALFANKTINNSLKPPSNFRRQVEQAISIFENHGVFGDDQEVVQFLIHNGIGASEAKEILVFLPIAFVRQLLPSVKWSDTYLQRDDNSKTIERKFSESKTYQIIWQATTEYFMGKPQKETVVKIGGRSAEFRVINQLLLDNPNYKPEDVKLTQTVIIL